METPAGQTLMPLHDSRRESSGWWLPRFISWGEERQKCLLNGVSRVVAARISDKCLLRCGGRRSRSCLQLGLVDMSQSLETMMVDDAPHGIGRKSQLLLMLFPQIEKPQCRLLRELIRIVLLFIVPLVGSRWGFEKSESILNSIVSNREKQRLATY